MYKLVFYVPATHLQQVKSAVFNAGAGKIGQYEHCAWEVLGTGQFKPLPGSQPFIGSEGNDQSVEEYRVEMVCKNELIENAVEALVQAHPYETPAYDVWMLDERFIRN